MRWLLVGVVLGMHLFSPMVLADGSDNTNGEIANVIAPSSVVVHPNETVQTYITVHNKAAENQVFSVDALTVPEPISIIDLPKSELLVPNHLRQFTFGMMADGEAGFQNLSVTFSVTSDLDPSFNRTVQIDVMIAPWSNLSFGVTGDSSFTVDETIRTAVAVNITNNASMADNVTFSLYTSSSWNWGWDMPNTHGGDAYVNMGPEQLVYVYLWVDVPAVENGEPLAGTGPQFVLSATSALDRRVSDWTFNLVMNEKKNATIDELNAELIVAPNTDGRAKAIVRNVGNTPNTLNITLQGVTEDGTPLTTAADRFNMSGWVVALFGGIEEVELQPNQSREIEIGVQAPNEFSGEIHVELKVFATGAQSLLESARMKASIVREASASLSWNAEGCDAILPNQSCSVSVMATNTGNAYDTVVLRTGALTDGFDVTIPPDALLLQTNQAESFNSIRVHAAPDALAFKLGMLELELVGDAGVVLATANVPLKVAPEIKWSFRNVEESVDARGRLNIAMEVRNEGNAVDGLVVQLQSSHTVNMGFIPPEVAVFEDGVEYPRSFEINDIPLNSNFTIRAWADLPTDQSSNGTVYINTTIRSRFAPELPFVHTSTGDYLGVKWQPTEMDDEGFDLTALANTAFLYLRAWSSVIGAVLLAGLIIYKAVTDREKRLSEQNLLPYQQQSEQAEDWMKQFARPEEEPAVSTPVEPLSPVPKATYEAMFRHEHGSASPSQSPVDASLVGAATLVLDRRTEDAMKSKADNILASIQEQGVAAPLHNQHLVEQVQEPQLKHSDKAQLNTPPDDDLEF